jgi:hypothetical protein
MKAITPDGPPTRRRAAFSSSFRRITPLQAGFRRLAVVLAGAAGLFGFSAVGLPTEAAALPSNCSASGSMVTCSFTSTGNEQSFVVPSGVSSLHVVAVGAAGQTSWGAGGSGAQVTGDLSVLTGQTMYVEVGVGGGAGAAAGGAGGGESDVRTCSVSDGNCPALGTAQDPRLIVAGGGGGGGVGGGAGHGGSAIGSGATSTCQPGAAGQGTAGGTEISGGGGVATCASGGAAGAATSGGGQTGNAGSAGHGGAGGGTFNGGAGGGAGYFGGGGGGGPTGSGSGSGAGGGGGSSYGPSGAVFTAASSATPSVTISYAASAPALTSADHATFHTAQAGSFTVTSTGVPAASLSETGALPSGVTFTDNGDGTATLSGTPASGTGGSYPLTITAANGVSPAATQSFTLTVEDPPRAAVSSPASGQTYVQGQSVPTRFACQEGAGGPGVASCDDSNGATSATGHLDTSGLGSHSYTVTATSNDGLSGEASISYTVDAVPTRPGATTATTTTTALTSSANPATTGARIALAATVTPTPSGGTVTFTDGGVTIGACTTLTVDAFGSVTCHTKYAQDGARVIAAVYSGDATSTSSSSAALAQIITDAPYSSGPAFSVGQSAPDSRGGFDVQVPLPGPGTVTVRAHDAQAQRLIGSVTIQATPQGIAVLHITPSAAAERLMRHGQAVSVRVRITYTRPRGRAIARTVTVRLREPLVVSHIHVHRDGNVEFDVTVPGPGQIDVMESAWKVNEVEEHMVLLGPAKGRFVFTRKHLVAKRTGTIRVTVRPNTRGLRLVAHHRGGILRIRLWVTYQANGGTPRTIGYYGLFVAR